MEKGNGKAIERIKEIIDHGKDLEDVRPGTSAELVSSVSGPALVDMIQVRNPDGQGADVEELASDLEFMLMDEAKVGSDILHRIMNV